ncbi:endonuclease III [SAR202 cluster bacterium AD-804-J14_MRT_500m]|nr:endonuclease III [SAR202 cluster bacterium AD-804-J14_MRT_500m]
MYSTKGKPTKKSTHRVSWPRKNRHLAAEEIIDLLGPSYGPFQHASRMDPTEELVFTILSQHTSDLNSMSAFRELMKEFGTLEAVASGDVRRIEKAITHGGLAKIKAPRIKLVLNLIAEKRGNLDLHFLSDMPLEQAKAWMRALPGIGPKSAAVILCFSLGMPAMAVDTHVHRVAKRLRLISSKTNADDAHKILEPMVPPEQVYAFHVALISHGRRICKALRPLCGECVLAFGCPSRDLGTSFSRTPKKPA